MGLNNPQACIRHFSHHESYCRKSLPWAGRTIITAAVIAISLVGLSITAAAAAGISVVVVGSCLQPC